jgi:type I restriction enzyme S subunit
MNKLTTDEWRKVRLNEILTVQKGLSYTSENYSTEFLGIPFITLKCVGKNGGFSSDGLKYYTGEDQGDFLVREGDLLFANTDLTRDGDVVGSPLRVPRFGGHDHAVFSMDLSKVSANTPHADTGFLFFLLSTYDVKRNMVRCAAGSTVLHLNVSDAVKFQVLLPPLAEQKKIADILTTVDEVIENTAAEISKLEDLKKATMNELLTKGIGHTEFKETEIGRIPKSWELVRLDSMSVANITKGSTPTTYGHEWVKNGILFLRSECVKDSGFSLDGHMRISEAAHNDLKRSQLQSGDLLIAITGYIGSACVLPSMYTTANMNQHIARVRIPDERIRDFVLLFINSQSQRKRYLDIQTGQAYPQLSLRQIQDTIVPIPPASELNQIVEQVQGLHEMITASRRKKEINDFLKSALMQDLLTGKVRVKVN